MIIDHISSVDVEKEFLKYRYIMIVKPEESTVEYETDSGVLFDVQTRLKRIAKRQATDASNLKDMVSTLKTRIDLLISSSVRDDKDEKKDKDQKKEKEQKKDKEQ